MRKRMKAVVNQFQEQLETHNKSLVITLTRETGIPLWESKQEVAMAHQYMDKLIAAKQLCFNKKKRPLPTSLNVSYNHWGPLRCSPRLVNPLLTSCWFSASALLMGKLCGTQTQQVYMV